jgi:hypothetical protein
VTETADRPAFSDSPVLVGPGRIQIESGFMVEREDDGPKSTRTLTWPQAELHTDVNTHLDVSVTWDGLIITSDLTSTSSGETRTTGGAHVRLGAKLGLVNRLMSMPRLSVTYSCRWGALRFLADTLIRSHAEHGASPSRIPLAFGDSGSGSRARRRGEVRAKPAASASLPGKTTASLGGFVGLVAESPELRSTPSVWSAQAGLELALGTRHQIDF